MPESVMQAKLATGRWWTIMPIVFITYSLAYLDRANFGFASLPGSTAIPASATGYRR
jgi:sugar phosphate permease